MFSHREVLPFYFVELRVRTRLLLLLFLSLTKESSCIPIGYPKSRRCIVLIGGSYFVEDVQRWVMVSGAALVIYLSRLHSMESIWIWCALRIVLVIGNICLPLECPICCPQRSTVWPVVLSTFTFAICLHFHTAFEILQCAIPSSCASPSSTKSCSVCNDNSERD